MKCHPAFLILRSSAEAIASPADDHVSSNFSCMRSRPEGNKQPVRRNIECCFTIVVCDCQCGIQLRRLIHLWKKALGHQLHETLVRLPSRRVIRLPNSLWHLADELARKETQFS